MKQYMIKIKCKCCMWANHCDQLNQNATQSETIIFSFKVFFDIHFIVHEFTRDRFHILTTLELSVKSPYLHPIFGPAFTPYPLFEWYPQREKIWLNLNMKCWNSAFNAQGSRVIIVVVQVGTVKIYIAAVEALRKKERQDKNPVYHQNCWKN
jgi:hypothetical protein